mmetsp:Transcript_20219/g.65135  ORF Transcript_20219/g.65135 Transcript_20219/m.65135 type:complete len:290 (-) Transcript_20219:1405-2274(-)
MLQRLLVVVVAVAGALVVPPPKPEIAAQDVRLDNERSRLLRIRVGNDVSSLGSVQVELDPGSATYDAAVSGDSLVVTLAEGQSWVDDEALLAAGETRLAVKRVVARSTTTRPRATVTETAAWSYDLIPVATVVPRRLQTCDDSCPLARDGVCGDSTGPVVAPPCDLGADCSDCADAEVIEALTPEENNSNNEEEDPGDDYAFFAVLVAAGLAFFLATTLAIAAYHEAIARRATRRAYEQPAKKDQDDDSAAVAPDQDEANDNGNDATLLDAETTHTVPDDDDVVVRVAV